MAWTFFDIDFNRVVADVRALYPTDGFGALWQPDDPADFVGVALVTADGGHSARVQLGLTSKVLPVLSGEYPGMSTQVEMLVDVPYSRRLEAREGWVYTDSAADAALDFLEAWPRLKPFELCDGRVTPAQMATVRAANPKAIRMLGTVRHVATPPANWPAVEFNKTNANKAGHTAGVARLVNDTGYMVKVAAFGQTASAVVHDLDYGGDRSKARIAAVRSGRLLLARLAAQAPESPNPYDLVKAESTTGKTAGDAKRISPIKCLKAADLEAGDVVRLRSGSPSMTVERVADNKCHAIWFESGKVARGVFVPAMLERVPS